MKSWLLFVALLGAAVAHADESPWRFDAPLTVAGVMPRTFHHLESAGRKSVAVSGATVAVAWEDNRDGTPRAYLAFKRHGDAAFSAARLISGGGAGTRPALVGLGGERFALAWEEDGQVWLRVATPRYTGPTLKIGAGAEVSLAAGRSLIHVAWSASGDKEPRVMVARVSQHAGALRLIDSMPVDAQPAVAPQLFPSLVEAADTSVVVAWEDRRPGHTVILASRRTPGKPFSPPQQLNEAIKSTSGFGAGSGSSRVALARAGIHLGAVWLDKRAGLTEGYDVYSASSVDHGAHFGANQAVQDTYGEAIAQWHPALAGNARGDFVAAFDDDREGNSDVLLAWRTDQGWSANLAPPGASGNGEQSDPALAVDDAGNVHLAWIAREEISGPSQVRYVYGRRLPAR